jgi:hypothetical protein
MCKDEAKGVEVQKSVQWLQRGVQWLQRFLEGGVDKQ